MTDHKKQISDALRTVKKKVVKKNASIDERLVKTGMKPETSKNKEISIDAKKSEESKKDEKLDDKKKAEDEIKTLYEKELEEQLIREQEKEKEEREKKEKTSEDTGKQEENLEEKIGGPIGTSDAKNQPNPDELLKMYQPSPGIRDDRLYDTLKPEDTSLSSEYKATITGIKGQSELYQKGGDDRPNILSRELPDEEERRKRKQYLG